MSDLSYSVVLPVYRQAEHVERIVASYTHALGRMASPYEILLVPNGPDDGTFAACRRMAETEEHVRSVPCERAGWGHAVRSGLAAAQGDLLCYTNSARTTPEDLTLTLLYARVFPGVVVKASRKIRESWRRRLGSLLYNLQCRSLFDLAYWDINGTPKVFPRALAPLLALTRDDDLIDLEFAIICRREGYRVLEVPIFSTSRHGGTSTTNYRSALGMYWGAYQMWRRLDRSAGSQPAPAQPQLGREHSVVE